MIVALSQDTDEWLAYRERRLGASDAAALMGVSPWKSAYTLWLEKTSKKKIKRNSSSSMQRGKDLEPIARAHFELMTGESWPDTVMQSDKYDFIMASLDGWNGEEVLEIKCPGKTDHLLALAGIVPEKYIYQLQWQMWVAGAANAHYVSFDGQKCAVVHHCRDEELIERMEKNTLSFWKSVTNKEWHDDLL